MSKKLWAVLLCACLMITCLSACSSEAETTTAAVESTSAAASEAEKTTPAAESSAAPETTAEPASEVATESAAETVTEAGTTEEAKAGVTITDMAGKEITVPSEVHSLINLWPALTSSFFVMGQGDLVKGVANNGPAVMNDWTQFFYPGALDIPGLGGRTPTVEELINLNPDLVIVHPITVRDGYQDQLLEVGIPALCVNYSNFDDMDQAYGILGEALGGEIQEKLNLWRETTSVKLAHVRELTADIPEEERPIVYYISGQDDSLTNTLGADSITQAWTEAAGGRYAMTMVDYTPAGTTVEFNAEELFALNPDVIIIGGTFQHQLMEAIQTEDGWKELKAVKNGRVYNDPYGCFNWDRFGMESQLQIDYALMCIQPELAEANGLNRDSMINTIIEFYKTYNGTELTAEQAGFMLDGLKPDGTAAEPQAQGGGQGGQGGNKGK